MAGESRLFVYGLWDPRTQDPFYIGKTRDPQARARAHLSELRLLPKLKRMESIIDAGHCPQLEIIDDVDLFSPDASWIEDYYISSLLKIGCRLTNAPARRVR